MSVLIITLLGIAIIALWYLLRPVTWSDVLTTSFYVVLLGSAIWYGCGIFSRLNSFASGISGIGDIVVALFVCSLPIIIAFFAFTGDDKAKGATKTTVVQSTETPEITPPNKKGDKGKTDDTNKKDIPKTKFEVLLGWIWSFVWYAVLPVSIFLIAYSFYFSSNQNWHGFYTSSRSAEIGQIQQGYEKKGAIILGEHDIKTGKPMPGKILPFNEVAWNKDNIILVVSVGPLPRINKWNLKDEAGHWYIEGVASGRWWVDLDNPISSGVYRGWATNNLDPERKDQLEIRRP